jgi:DNA-binding transcriptional LysR family regulator
MNLSGIDTNLFLVLHAVLKERSATRAAKRLNVTQSAVSNSLTRLRALLNDPLVVRSGRGLVPTPRASELFPRVDSAISQLQSVLDQQPGVDPTEITRCFTLACSDGAQIHDVPRIAESLSRHMPRASLRIVSMDYLVASNGLESGEVDAMMATRRAAKGLYWAELYREDGVLILRRNHPRVSKRISREIFNLLQHIDVIITSGQSGHTRKLYEAFLKKNGLIRRIVLTVPTFTAAALAVARTDYASGVPRRVAEALSDYLPIKIVELPFHGFNADVALIWHSRTHSDAAARHFRETIIAALSGSPKKLKDSKNCAIETTDSRPPRHELRSLRRSISQH